MDWFGAIAGGLLIGVVLIDAFEAMILPRRIRHSYRFAQFYYQTAWAVWQVLARRFPAGRFHCGRTVCRRST